LRFIGADETQKQSALSAPGQALTAPAALFLDLLFFSAKKRWLTLADR